MKISGFTMVKNADKLYYPIKQSILSILPIVDEFVVALGDCDTDDKTQSIIESIGSSKVKIVHTIWDTKKFPNGMENAHQTDIAKNHCTGDWLFYLQADEVVHEQYLSEIKKRCEELVDDKEVEGLLFSYKHFWGDYNHYVDSHGWYPHEIRIIKNDKDISDYVEELIKKDFKNQKGGKKGAKDNHYLIPVLKYYTDKFDVYKNKINGLEGIISSIIDPHDIGIIEAEINKLKALIPKGYI